MYVHTVCVQVSLVLSEYCARVLVWYQDINTHSEPNWSGLAQMPCLPSLSLGPLRTPHPSGACLTLGTGKNTQSHYLNRLVPVLTKMLAWCDSTS